MSDSSFSTRFVRDLLLAKLRNSKLVLTRAARNAKSESARADLLAGAQQLADHACALPSCENIDSMRGVEGAAATAYFARFDRLIESNPSGFCFSVRTRRPPRDEVNALLSFSYTLLTHEIQSAMETVGLDPAAGYLHTLRPGRPSFALDLIEELRAPLCDRFVVTLLNRGQVSPRDFDHDQEVVLLNERGRKTFLNAWQFRKQEIITHPFLNEKIPIGLIPYVQAMLFARVLRGDLDEYPPFLWR